MAESGRANCEFLMGIGTQRGIRFAVAQSSTLMDMYCKQQPYGWFADPNLPPNNGGRLMSAAEVFQHVHNHRNPRKLSDYVYPVQTSAPAVVQPLVTRPVTEDVPAQLQAQGMDLSKLIFVGGGGAAVQSFDGISFVAGPPITAHGSNGHDHSAEVPALAKKNTRQRKPKADKSPSRSA